MSKAQDKLRNYSPSACAETLSAIIPLEYAGLRFDQALSQLFPEYSRNRLQTWVAAARITLDGGTASGKQRVRGGERVTVLPELLPEEVPHAPETIALDIIHEDDALLVINKPPGLVVHPGSGNWSGTMLNALLAQAPALSQLPRAGIVHRLDKDTSGLLVVAKTLTAQTDLVRQLQARTVSRTYLALVSGRVQRAGHIDAPIGRHPSQRTRMAVVDTGKPAVTHYTPLEHGAGWTLLECKLESGRTHQIRVHLQKLGHAILGDPTYGPRSMPPHLRHALAGLHRQALHAIRLTITHPESGERMQWEAPLPHDFAATLERLRVL